MPADKRDASGAATQPEEDTMDYGIRLAAAEEAAAAALGQVLEDGGQALLYKHTQRKAYPYSVDTAMEAIMSNLDMCFVQHTHKDPQADWQLAPEPAAMETDSWGRNQVQPQVLRKRTKQPSEASCNRFRAAGSFSVPHAQNVPGTGKRLWSRRHSSPALGKGETNQRSATKSGQPDLTGYQRADKDKDKEERRSFPIKDDFEPDEEEDKWRLAKVRRDARRVEEEQEAARAKQQEEEKKRLTQMRLQDGGQTKPYTFDSYGNKIFVNQPQVDDLPQLHEKFHYDIVARSRLWQERKSLHLGSTAAQLLDAIGADGTLPQSRKAPRFPDAPVAAKSRSVRRGRPSSAPGGSTKKAARQKEVFTDWFSRPESEQPPLIETMQCQPGVTLVCDGKVKVGPEQLTTRMTRAQYLEMVVEENREGSTAGSPRAVTVNQFARAGSFFSQFDGINGFFGPQAAPSRSHPGTRPSSPVHSVTSAADAQLQALQFQLGAPELAEVDSLGVTEGKGGGPTAVRVVKMMTQRPRSAVSENVREQDAKDQEKVKTPAAPSQDTRAKKAQSLGTRAWAPRERVAVLGTPARSQYGAAQPPPKAAVGQRSATQVSREDFHFVASPALARSGSDAQLRANRLGAQAVGARSRPRSAPGGRRPASIGG